MTKRSFGTIAKNTNRQTGKTTGYLARYTGPDLGKHSKTFTAKVDAEAWLRAEEGLVARGVWTPPKGRQGINSVTVAEYARTVIDSRDLAPRTREEYERYLARFVVGTTLGNAPLTAVQPSHVWAWHQTLKTLTGPTMAARVYGFVSSVFGQAETVRLIEKTPCVIKGAASVKRKSQITSATPEEVSKLLQEVPDRYKALVLVTAYGGLRSGEVRGLRTRDVDLKAGTISVRGQVQQIKGQGLTERDPKTEAGRRTIYLPAPIIEVLKVHMAEFSQPFGWLFPNTVGKPTTYSPLWNVFNKARKSINRPDLRFHDLRATGLTLAAQSGATIAELMKRAGHTTPNAAMKYQHAAEERDKMLAASMPVVLPQTMKPTKRPKKTA